MKAILEAIENLILWKHAKKSRSLEIRFEDEEVKARLYDYSIGHGVRINVGEDIPDLEEEKIKADKEYLAELQRKYA